MGRCGCFPNNCFGTPNPVGPRPRNKGDRKKSCSCSSRQKDRAVTVGRTQGADPISATAPASLHPCFQRCPEVGWTPPPLRSLSGGSRHNHLIWRCVKIKLSKFPACLNPFVFGRMQLQGAYSQESLGNSKKVCSQGLRASGQCL